MPQVNIKVVVPVTRYWALNQLGDSLKKLQVPKDAKLSFLFYVDTPDPRVQDGLNYWLGDLPTDEVIVHNSGNPEPTEVRIAPRRQRVVDAHKEMALLIGDQADYVFGIEDDTIVPDYALVRLLRFMQTNKNVGLIQGVQCGRWGYKHIGAWRVNDIANPTKVLTMPYVEVNRTHSFVEGIDGGGFFCYLTPATLFKRADYRIEAECLGVDMLYGLDLKRQGYSNFIDWSIVCGHNDFGQVIMPELGRPCEQMLYEKEGKAWQLSVRVQGGEWERK